jgi:3-dehydroquinate synthase
MEGLQMSNSFSVISKVKGLYQVNFIDDLSISLNTISVNKDLVFIIDEQVARLFKNELHSILLNCRHILVESSEENKTMDYAQELIRALIKLNIRKNDSLVAIGGGITQDLVTFIASILFRGIDWKFFPTTLLAQCDSCIGSKSSINFDQFKNLIGTFNPPSEIFIYAGFLNTLSTSEIKSGIGEMLHYFFTEGIELAQEVSDKFESLLVNRSLLPYFISSSLRIKKTIIEIDEFDTSIRHIFNYGHTFGHALEAITEYAIPHGQAISLGMDLANYISLKRGMINNNQFDKMHVILEKNIPLFVFTEKNIDSYFNALSKDKKNKGAQLGCILTFGPGKVEKVFIAMDDNLRSIILEYSKKFGA